MQKTPLLVVLLLTLIAACAPAEAPQDAGTGLVTEALTDNGTWRVRYTPDPDPIPLNDLFELRVEVTRADDDTPLADTAVLDVEARMPAHNHGMNVEPEIAREADGSFTVTGMQMHMPGAWELYVDIEEGGVVERATFDVPLDQ